MAKVPRDEEREQRISDEIIVDCYNEGEAAMGWYYYLQDKMAFPFRATCVTAKKKSRLKVGEQVEILAMADEGDCEHEMWVEVKGNGEVFIVLLEQLQPLDDVDAETIEAIEDWQYWLKQGYQLS
ncbi:MAG: calcium-binding protein [Bacteroidota bacterium]